MQNSKILKAVSVLLTITLFLSVFTFSVSADDTEEKIDYAAKVANMAYSQRGYSEIGGYTKYGDYFGQPYVAWCGAFVAWCARQSGVSEKVIPNILSSTALRDHYAAQGRYHLSKSYDKSTTYKPKKGDIAFFTSYNGYHSKDNICHVGIVYEVTNDYVICIEGNCPNSVAERKRYFNSYLVGFASPAYPSEPATYSVGTYVTNAKLNLREDSTLGSNVLTVVPQSTDLYISSVMGSYGKTVYEGKTGWVSLDYCVFKSATKPDTGATTPSAPETPDVDYVQYKLRANMYMRTSASASASKVFNGTIPAGTIINVTEVSDNNWGKTTYMNYEGWVCLDWSVKYTAPEVDWLVMDISYSQSPSDLDWMKLKSEGVKGVIIRIGARGYGNEKKVFSDASFLQHYKAAKAAGMYVGVYFFSYALTKAEAIEEANYTLDILKINNCKLDLPVYIDMEDDPGDSKKQHATAGKAVCSLVLDEFCKTIENAGYYAGIYCSRSFAEDFVNPSVFEGRSTWIAEWGVESCTYSGNVDMWQYTEDGRLSGAGNKDIDLNRLYVDYPSKINADLYEKGIIETGDINCDGKVTAYDSRLALRASVALEKLTSLQSKIGDINGDGKVTSADARDILIKAVS